MTFTGERLYLRPLTSLDATPAYASWLNDPEVNRYLATKSATVEELRGYIEAKNAKADTELYGIFLRADDQHIGTIKLEPIDRVQRTAQIGILIGEKVQWGKGYAGEAMQLLFAYCFEQLSLRELTLGVVAQNTSAVRAYSKLGFIEVRREVGAVHYPNGVFDQVSMIKTYA